MVCIREMEIVIAMRARLLQSRRLRQDVDSLRRQVAELDAT